MRTLRISSATALAIVLTGCQSFYKFENQNLRAVEAENIQVPPSFPKATISYPVADTSLTTVATNIAGRINGSADFQNAGVSAGTPVTSGAQVTIPLTYNPSSTIALAGSATTTGNTKGSEVLTFASPSAGLTNLTLTGAATPGDTVTVTTSPAIKDALGAVVLQSEKSCANFLAGLVLFETGSNTSLDILSTITSAIGSVLSPIETVHALSASTTILTGSKTALDADIYAKASIANFAAAIQATYYADMSKYVTGLSTADPSTLSWPIEIYKITVIHRECALAPAESSISKTIETPATPTASTTALTVSFKATDTTLATVATNIAKQIKSSTAFQNASVSAGTPKITASMATIALTYPATTTITWSSSVTTAGGAKAGETITFPTAPNGVTLTMTGTVAVGDTITITGTPAAGQAGTGTTPAAVQPGHKINSSP